MFCFSKGLIIHMPKASGTAMLQKNGNFCNVHFNRTIVYKSFELLSMSSFYMPKPFGAAKMAKNDNFSKIHLIKLYYVEVKINVS